MATLPHGTITEFCYVTTDMDSAIKRWGEVFRAGPFYKLVMPQGFGERNYRGKPAEDAFAAALGFCGNTLVEFIQPLNDAPSVFREVLEEKGNLALHHIMPDIRPLSASDYDALDAKYRKLGYDPAIVMTIPGLGRNTLFDARPQLGSFVEIIECTPAMYKGLENQYTAHLGWDGQRPIRDFQESMH